jgi:hypothetical protein
MTVMAFSPSASTWINATPVAVSTAATPAKSMPDAVRFASAAAANASRPTAPNILRARRRAIR